MVVFVGKLSYSLYLWHWPVYCFVDYSLYAQTGISRILLKIVLTVLFSICSFFIVESPARSYLNKPKNRRLVFLGFATGVIFVSFLGITIRNHQYIDANVRGVTSGGKRFNIASNAPLVVLMGDSQGSMYGTTMKSIAASAG